MNDWEKEKSTIEEMKNRLHARRFKSKVKDVRSQFFSRDPDVPQQWEQEEEIAGKESAATTNPMLKKVFLASIVFFVAAAGIAVYLFLGGGNVVSSENVDIEVLGPVSVAGGEELSLQMVITNNNNAELQFADLSVEFPEGTHDPNNLSSEMPRYRTSLNSIEPGETVNEIVRAVLFGEEGEEKRIKITVEYRVEGSNAIFVKDIEYVVSISSAPVSVSLEALEEVNTNQEIELLVKVSSNSEQIIENMALRMQYPFGFEPENANPKSTYGTDIWELGDLRPGDTKTIRITGTIRGQNEEERIFSAHVGKQSEENERTIATVFSSSVASMQIKRPFIGADLALNGTKTQTYTVRAGETVNAQLDWISNLSQRAENVVLEAELSGDVDQFSVAVTQGFFDSNTNTVTWNQATYDPLESVEPGEQGSVGFRFAPRGGADISNPEITISVHVSARRIAEQATSEEVRNILQRTVQASSDLRLASRGVHFAGPFNNSGAMPPKAEDTTTYTIIWTVTNPENDISEAQVTATLPLSVAWTGLTDPGGANISYNSNTRQITWNVGNVPAGSGFTSVAKEVAFQVALTPSVSDIGDTPALVQSTVLRGRDNFTNSDVEYTRPPVTTSISTDPSFTGIQGQVVE